MTPDAQALAEILAELNGDELTYAWIPDAHAALEWVAANLHVEGDAGDALRERLGLTWCHDDWCPNCGPRSPGTRCMHRLHGPWEPLP